MNACSAQGCERDIKARGLCRMHHNRLLRGHPEGGNPRRARPACKFDGCERLNSARGYCSSHAWQIKHGNPLTPISEPKDRKCSGPSCNRQARRFADDSLCRVHDRQLRDRGYLSPIRDPRPMRDPEIFWGHVQKISSGCWEWQANVSLAGYGTLNIGQGKYAYAHRYSWEITRGPIPEGLTIDHLCRNKRCVNPDHLEPVTQAENNRRAREAKAAALKAVSAP